MPTDPKSTKPSMTEAQRAYEEKRAAKAGVSLDAWLARKQKEQQAATAATALPCPKRKMPALVSRLLERARRPI